MSVKISEQIALGRNNLAISLEEELDSCSNKTIFSCNAIGRNSKAADWYFKWLQDNGCDNLYDDTYSLFNIKEVSPETQYIRFMLMCFAELAAIDEGH